MSVNEFAEKVRKAAQEILGPEYFIEDKENTKLNGVKRRSLIIHSQKGNIAPMIYLDPYYADYENGESFGDVMKDIMKMYWDHVPKEDFDLEQILNFDYVKSRICIKLCNTEKNLTLLEDTAHIEFNDLSIVFFIELDEGPVANGDVLVKESFLEEWKTNTEELMKIAMKNSLTRYPPKIQSMCEFFEGYLMSKVPCMDAMRQKQIEEFMDRPVTLKSLESNLYILSNQRLVNGSACILYPKVIEDFSESVGSNVYIIPSSIHEVILIPESVVDIEYLTRDEAIENIKGMIAFVNDSELPPTEFLSYNLYYFDRDKKNITAV